MAPSNPFVAARVRPPGGGGAGGDGAMTSRVSVVVAQDGTSLELEDKTYAFDQAFGPRATQTEVYTGFVDDAPDLLVGGYNVCLMAYGQTGTGKTHTIRGPPNDQGILPRLLLDIFSRLYGKPFTVRLRSVEQYKGKLYDLLVDKRKKADSNVTITTEMSGPRAGKGQRASPYATQVVKGATKVAVHSWEEARHVIDRADRHRATDETNMNDHSSRSHAVTIIDVTTVDAHTGELLCGTGYVVDLAGSESIATASRGKNSETEAIKNNSTLEVLGRVVRELAAQGKKGKRKRTKLPPFRESQLTRMLQNCVGGNARLGLLVTLSPVSQFAAESRATLAFASTAKQITQQASQNRKGKISEELVQRLQARIADLEAQVGGQGGKETPESGRSGVSVEEEEEEEEEEEDEDDDEIEEGLERLEAWAQSGEVIGLQEYQDLMEERDQYEQQYKNALSMGDYLSEQLGRREEELETLRRENDSLAKELRVLKKRDRKVTAARDKQRKRILRLSSMGSGMNGTEAPVVDTPSIESS